MENKGKSIFQLALFGIFGLAIVVAVLIFSGLISVGSQTATQVTGTVEIWGTIPSSYMTDYIEKFSLANDTLKLKYVQKSDATFNNDLVEALASGRGPDLVFLTEDMILKQKERIFPIPSTSISERTIKDAFVRESELLITKDGLLGLPVSIDPLVLYYNRDLFDKAGIATVPKTWEEVAQIAPLLTKINKADQKIEESAIALGEFSNITNAKDILALFMLQSGTPIIGPSQDSPYQCTLRDSLGVPNSTLEQDLSYFLDFSNPTSKVYSWNRGLPNSRDFFVLGKLAMYIGRGSELFSMSERNPNLNYDVAQIPQFKDSTNTVTSGRMLSVSILKSTKNMAAAFSVASTLSGADFQADLSSKLSLPSPRRDLLSIQPSSAYAQSFYTAALTARSWLDPDSDKTDIIFSDLINSISSGRGNLVTSLTDACSRIDSALSEVTSG